MKIRLGFVSNSSSTSFSIPSFLLTDEQKEMLLSMDDMKKTKAQLQKLLGARKDINHEDSKNDYLKNDDYHRIYKEMIKADEWHDSGWAIGEDKKYRIINGSTDMWNGSIDKFMEKIGIDPTMIEIVNEGHHSVYMATHPEAVKHHIWLYGQWLEHWAGLSDKDKEFDISMGMRPHKICPYSLSNDKFKLVYGNTLEYTPEAEDDYQDTYSYTKDKKDED